MKKSELCTELQNYDEIYGHIKRLLELTDINDTNSSDTLLIFEALYNDMIARGIPGDTQVTVRMAGSFGSVKILLRFGGKLYLPLSYGEEGPSIEQRVMLAYGDRIGNRYYAGSNYLTLVARRSARIAVRTIGIAAALAVAAFFAVTAVFDSSRQETIREGVFQVEMLFTRVMLGVGAPVTFFSLLSNLTNMYVLREEDSLMRAIQVRALVSSVLSVVLAVFTAIAVQFPMKLIYYGGTVTMGDILPRSMDVDIDLSLGEMVQSVVSSSIFEPFETFAPFPIIVFALLTSAALCSAGSYFESIKKAVDGCYVLFSRMLGVVMYTLPFFFFMAMLEGMLRQGPGAVLYALGMTVLVPVSMIVLVLFYAVWLGAMGINPFQFMKKLGPLLKENVIINSTIEAVPFNIRYCIIRFGFDRKRAEHVLPMLAQINLDGNCFIITLIALMLMFTTGSGNTWFDVIIVGTVVFFLSLGAPNQPGSILIGLLVILSYMEAMDLISLAIYAEAIFGAMLSATNAAGDIVTLAITDKYEKARQRPGSGND